jgi:hypothetical protein
MMVYAQHLLIVAKVLHAGSEKATTEGWGFQFSLVCVRVGVRVGVRVRVLPIDE